MTDIGYMTERIICNFMLKVADMVIRNVKGDCVLNAIPILQNEITKVQLEDTKKDIRFDTVDNIMEYYRNYVRLVAEVNILAPFTPTRHSFCLFCGIDSQSYYNLLSSKETPYEIVQALNVVEDYLIMALQTGGLQGNLSPAMSKNVLQTHGKSGHNLATVKEASEINNSQMQVNSKAKVLADMKKLTIGG